MSAVQRGRAVFGLGAACSLAAVLGLAAQSLAQQPQRPAQNPGRASVAPSPSGGSAADQPVVEIKPIPVNPGDPVAIVNNEVITRQQLADECVARKGQEILDTLIARRLIDQALKQANVQVTEAEIFAEIDRIAANLAGVSREKWLSTLSKERNISPAQYARDVIYPALALRKLAVPRVQITDQDIQDAYESQFGEKLMYRMIMTRSLDHAKQVWEELKKNPGSFAQVAMNDPRSIDPATRATGGEPTTGPLTRHAFPRDVTSKIFKQLVDGEADDKPEQKPQDGDISGPIQVTEEGDAWVIVQRKGVIPTRDYDKNDPELSKQIKDAIFESKVQQHMEQVYGEIVQLSVIENKLTGNIKQAQKPEGGSLLDLDVKRSSQTAQGTPPSPAPNPSTPAAAAAAAAASQPKLPPPPGVSPAEIRLREGANQQPK